MSTYDLAPEVKIHQFDGAWAGYKDIAGELLTAIQKKNNEHIIVAIECYPGTRNEEIVAELLPLLPVEKAVFADEWALNNEEVTNKVQSHLTDDRVFGIMSHYEVSDFYPAEKLAEIQAEISASKGLVVIYGTGATVIAPNPDILIYADLARWRFSAVTAEKINLTGKQTMRMKMRFVNSNEVTFLNGAWLTAKRKNFINK